MDRRISPVARRTRSKEALYLKELHENIKKANKYVHNVSESDVIDSSSRGKKRKKIGLVGKKMNVRVDSSESSDDVACIDNDDVQFMGYDGWGSSNNPKNLGVEKFGNSTPVVIDSSSEEEDVEDGEVEIITEKEGNGCSDDDEDVEMRAEEKESDRIKIASSSNNDSEEQEDSSQEDSDDSDDPDELESSDEDNDRSSDEDFVLRDRIIKHPMPSDSEEISDNVNVSNSNKREMNDMESKVEEAMFRFQRSKAKGLDVLVDSGKHKKEDRSDFGNRTRKPESVAGRTRSRLGSEGNEKITKLGTANAKDDDSDDHEDHAEHPEKKTSVDDYMSEEDGTPYEKLGKSSERNGDRGSKKFDFVKILLDSILNKSNELAGELTASGNLDQETIATWKFIYPLNDSDPNEESEGDEGDNSLWMEFDFGIRSLEIGSTDSFMMNADDSAPPDVTSDPATLCSRGHHRFIINEEIGLICKFCHFVDLEMRFISPSFDKRTCRRLESKDYSQEDDHILNELNLQDSVNDFQSGFDRRVHVKGTVWELIPGMQKSMYQHQREGFEFIWKIIAGSITLHDLKSNNFKGGSGCVISHAPGTGKTRLILAFLHAYIELNPTCKPVIIAPCSMLLTWEEQCKTWNFPFPFHNLNNPELSDKEDKAVLKLLREVKNQHANLHTRRMTKIYSWALGKSVLGLSYRLFERLVNVDNVSSLKNHRKQSRVDSEIKKIILEHPGLLVLDEGHTARNEKSLLWKALSKIETEKRIILSGTPFQNNFVELYNTLCLVRPKFAKTVFPSGQRKTDSHTKRGERDKWDSLTNSIGSHVVDTNRLGQLRAIIDPFVHVHKGNILQESLPGIRDSVIVLRPTIIQSKLLERVQRVKDYLKLIARVSMISAHPSLGLKYSSDLEIAIVEEEELELIRLDPEVSVKTKFLLELIKLSEALNEKVLVFSQFLEPLHLIRDQLKSHFRWNEGEEILYMDGALDVKQRQSSINVFNEATSKARVLLASTKACSEGINLIGASRVVLLDVVWNPSVERQAISRAYRLGQKRIVYVYHLITSGTIEWDIYCCQAKKDRLSGLVFSSNNDCSDGQKISDTVSDDKILEEMVQHEKLKDIFEEVIYQPKESYLIGTFGRESTE